MIPRSLEKGWFTPALFLFSIAWLLTFGATSARAQVRPTYLYPLSDFSGPLYYEGVRLHADRDRGEIYVLYQNVVRVFNPSGMQIFAFGDDLDVGHIVDVTVDAKGDVMLLSYKDGRSLVTRCDFRGTPLGEIQIRNLPEGLVFSANRMVYRKGTFYFVSQAASVVIVVDADGVFQKQVEFGPLLDADEKTKTGAELDGFAVDDDGNLYFTMPTLFRAYKMSPDGTMTYFGRPGSAAGRFGVVSGIAVDSQGNILVADKLRSVVMVFAKDFSFLAEFGYRGTRPQNLIVPSDITIDGKDRVYISQSRRRGISVFALNPGETEK